MQDNQPHPAQAQNIQNQADLAVQQSNQNEQEAHNSAEAALEKEADLVDESEQLNQIQKVHQEQEINQEEDERESGTNLPPCPYQQDQLGQEQQPFQEECYDKDLHEPHEEQGGNQQEAVPPYQNVEQQDVQQGGLQNNQINNDPRQSAEILQTLYQDGQCNYCNHIAEYYQNQSQPQHQQQQKDQQPDDSSEQQNIQLYHDLLEEEKIELEKEAQSDVSHVYGNQQIIEEWRDQEVEIRKHHFHNEGFSVKSEDYEFVGIHDYESEKIEVTATQFEPDHQQTLTEKQAQKVQQTAFIAKNQQKPQSIQNIKPKETSQSSKIKEASTVKQSKVEDQNIIPKPVSIQSNVGAQKTSVSKPKQSEIRVDTQNTTKSNIVKRSNQVNFKKEKVTQSQPPAQNKPTQQASQIKSSTKQSEPSKILPEGDQKIKSPQKLQPKAAEKSSVKKESVVEEKKSNIVIDKQSTAQNDKISTSNQLLLRSKKQADREKQAEIKKRQAEQKELQLRKQRQQKIKQQKQKQKEEFQRKQEEKRQRQLLQRQREQRQKQRQQAQLKLKQQKQENQRKERLRLEAELLEKQKKFNDEKQIQQKRRKQAQLLQRQRIEKEETEIKQKQKLQAEKIQKQRIQREQKLRKQQQQALNPQPNVAAQKIEEAPAASQLKVLKKKKKKKKVNSENPKKSTQKVEGEVGRSNNNGGEGGIIKQPSVQSNQQRLSEIDHSEPRRASLINSRQPSQPSRPDQRNIVTQIMNSQSFIADKNQQKAPLLTSLIVVKEAEKQRVGTTYKMFLKYNYEYERTVATYKRIVRNVCTELEAKKQNKRPLQRLLEEYFEDFGQLCRQFNQRCYKIQLENEVVSATKNPFGNIRLQLKKGFDQMIYLRKSIANNSNRLNVYVANTVLPQVKRAFEVYYSIISQEETKQLQRLNEHQRKQKLFNKVASQLDKNFNKGLEGKFKDDLFIDITRYINEEKVHRVALRNFGRGLIDLRHTYIRCQKQLFDRLQEIINKFKFQSRSIYCFGPRLFYDMIDYTQNIKKITKFTQLCTLVDLDYIKYVLQLQNKKETNEFTNRNFQSYLDLIFFDRVVGNIRDMLKGATNKVFPMQTQGQELVHSISGNMILFYRPQDHCKDQYVIKNLNAKIIGSGFVEFDQLLKGIFFDDNRTIRLKLKDDDRAEELICYLNEKQEDIVLGEPQQ